MMSDDSSTQSDTMVAKHHSMGIRLHPLTLRRLSLECSCYWVLSTSRMRLPKKAANIRQWLSSRQTQH